MADAPRAFRFTETFVHLGHDDRAAPIEVTESFWPDLISGRLALGPGRLATFYEFSEDWSSWEAHPAGEELVCLVSGRMVLRVELEGEEHRIELSEPGAFVLVPKGAWHTADVPERSRALFVTAGDGTTHRSRA